MVKDCLVRYLEILAKRTWSYPNYNRKLYLFLKSENMPGLQNRLRSMLEVSPERKSENACFETKISYLGLKT